tara:strand:+ start:244 stop:489 length:246 start_codon:yes stop_codon:yes gene_type:complete
MSYFKIIALRIIALTVIVMAFVIQERTFAFEAYDRSELMQNLSTLRDTTDVASYLSSCDAEKVRPLYIENPVDDGDTNFGV